MFRRRKKKADISKEGEPVGCYKFSENGPSVETKSIKPLSDSPEANCGSKCISDQAVHRENNETFRSQNGDLGDAIICSKEEPFDGNHTGNSVKELKKLADFELENASNFDQGNKADDINKNLPADKSVNRHDNKSTSKDEKESAREPTDQSITEQESQSTGREERPSKADSGHISNTSKLNDNLLFYRGKINSKPFPGYKITEMLKWKGNYSRLENNHSYIQWLFPLYEGRGMNHAAQALQEHEAEAIRSNDELRGRVLEAYKMMLDFYGMELVDPETGKVQRNSKNWKDRYAHLNKSSHNYLRITRILKALGELGWEHLQRPWLEFLIEEIAVSGYLPRLADSKSVEFWIRAIKDFVQQIECFDKWNSLRNTLKDSHAKEENKTTNVKNERSAKSAQKHKISSRPSKMHIKLRGLIK